jgi:hypothetical protein
VEILPDSGHAVPRESGETMNRRPRRNHTPAFKTIAMTRRRDALKRSRETPRLKRTLRRHRLPQQSATLTPSAWPDAETSVHEPH